MFSLSQFIYFFLSIFFLVHTICGNGMHGHIFAQKNFFFFILFSWWAFVICVTSQTHHTHYFIYTSIWYKIQNKYSTKFVFLVIISTVHNILFKVQRSEYFLGRRGEKFINRGRGSVGGFLPLYMTKKKKNVFKKNKT